MDEALGLLFLGAYIVGVVALAAGVTWAVIRIFPTERTPKKDDEPRTAPENGTSATAAPREGSLFRRSKRKS